MILSPRSKNYLRKLLDGEARFILQPEWCPPIYVSKQIADTYGAGSASIAITGDYTNVIIGLREQLQIEVLKEVKAQKYQIVLLAALRMDIAIIRPAAFDCITGILSNWNS